MIGMLMKRRMGGDLMINYFGGWEGGDIRVFAGHIPFYYPA
jgi:hypothetical protein